MEHNNNNKINKEDDLDSEPNDEVSKDDVYNQPADNNESDGDNDEAPYASNNGEEETSVASEDDNEEQVSTSVIPVETVPDENEETGVDDDTETMDVETTGVDITNNSTTMDTGAKAGVGSWVHILRPRRAPNYSRHMHGTSPSKKTGYNLEHLQQLEYVAMSQNAASEVVRNIMKLEYMSLTQYSVKKSLKVCGEEGIQAVISEIKQLDIMDVIDPMEAQTMTRVEKRSALEKLIFLKKKRCGRIKTPNTFLYH